MRTVVAPRRLLTSDEPNNADIPSQWFPEAARCLALQGAELLFFPTAIGSEPQDGGLDSRQHWRRVMQGHAGANMTPVIASNRIGTEALGPDPTSARVAGSTITFYGTSFVADETGAVVAEADDRSEAVRLAAFDLDGIAAARAAWGMFRDRRPELYGPIMSKDGRLRVGPAV